MFGDLINHQTLQIGEQHENKASVNGFLEETVLFYAPLTQRYIGKL